MRVYSTALNERYFSVKDILIFALFFFLPAANNYPGKAYYFFTLLHGANEFSFINLLLLPVLIMAELLIITRLANDEKIYSNISRFSFILLITVSIFFVAGIISTIANHELTGVVTTFMSSIASVWMISIAVINYRLNAYQSRLIFLSFTLGCLFPLVLGIYAYYHSWGIPNLSILLVSHFNIYKMAPYAYQTFGNTDNTSAFMGMVGVVFFSLMLNERSKKYAAFFGIIFTLTLIHIIILEIRTTIICFFVITAIISYVKSKKFFFLYIMTILGIIVIIYLLFPKSMNFFLNRMHLAMTWSGSESDISAIARLTAMKMGLNVFWHNFLLGVGPGASRYYISFSTAHQFNIQEGVELGVLGCFASISLCFLAIYNFLRIAYKFALRRINYEALAFASAPAFYFMYAMLANAPLALGVVNTWICLAVVMLFLSDSCDFS